MCIYPEIEQQEGTSGARVLGWGGPKTPKKDELREGGLRGGQGKCIEVLIGRQGVWSFSRDNGKLLKSGRGNDVTTVAIWRTVGSGKRKCHWMLSS